MGSYFSSAKPVEEIEDEDLVENENHVEIGDQNAVKNILDDTIVEYFQNEKVYTIHYGWDNTKLLLMAVAAAIAATSHFYKTPAISEQTLILICVVGFFVIQAMLLAYTMFIERDILLRMSKKAGGPLILVKTTFPATEDTYTIVIQYDTEYNCAIKQNVYVGNYFDSEGYFAKDKFVQQVGTTVAQFQKQKKKP